MPRQLAKSSDASSRLACFRRMSAVVAAFAFVAEALSSSPCHAQSEKWRKESTFLYEQGPASGRALLSDVDGDGRREIATSWLRDHPVGADTFHAALLSGADLSRLAVFDLPSQPTGFGAPFVLANAGDVDGDGFDDLAVGTPSDQDGRVDVFSIPSGALLLTLRGSDPLGRFGAEIVGIGDIDGDGSSDFAVGAPGAKTGTLNTGRITIHSGYDGAILLDWHEAGGILIGDDGMLAVTSDRDADGVADLQVLVPASAADQVVTLSSASGLELGRWSVDPSDPLYRIAPFSDVDGDGIDDVLCASFNSVVLRSSGDGRVLNGIAGFIIPIYRNVGRVADLDGDGCDECFVAVEEVVDPDFTFHSVIEVRSACTGALFFRLEDDFHPAMSHALAIDDADGDGHPDLAVSGFETHDVGDDGLLLVAGHDGAKLGELIWKEWFDSYGGGMALYDDLDGDGLAELLLHRVVSGDGDEPHPTLILSSRDGAILHAFDGPYGLACPGGAVVVVPDRDGDGRSEYLIGNGGETRQKPLVQLRNGATGEVITSIASTLDWNVSGYGAALAAGIESTTGELKIGIGAPAAANGPRSRAGKFEVRNADGKLLLNIFGISQDDYSGSAAAWIGDVNGDGKGDWAVGAPYRDEAQPDAGRVSLHSGSTGALLRVLKGTFKGGLFGFAVAAVPDVDGDGLVDLLVGEPYGGSNREGQVHLHSCATGALIATWTGDTPYTVFGALLGVLPDANQDGDPEFMFGWGLAPKFDLVAPWSGRLLREVAPPTSMPSIHTLASVDALLADHLPRARRPLLAASTRKSRYIGQLPYVTLIAYDIGDLFLDVQPPSAAPGETVTAAVRGGPAGSYSGIYVARIDDLSFDRFLLFGFLDSFGEWTSVDVTPPGLSGMTYLLRAYALGFDGRLASSTDHELVFE